MLQNFMLVLDGNGKFTMVSSYLWHIKGWRYLWDYFKSWRHRHPCCKMILGTPAGGGYGFKQSGLNDALCIDQMMPGSFSRH